MLPNARLDTVSRLALATAIVTSALSAALACAFNPVSRRPEFVVMSRDAERRLGEQEARKVEQELGIVVGEDLAAYVEKVGGQLAEHSPRQDVEYRFLVVDSDMINAFALPSGHVYVTRGLLARLNSEDELANVIGHEIGHVAARHAVQRVTRAAPLAVATGIPAAAVGLMLPRLGRGIGSVGQFAGSLVLAPYSRSQESESDRLGQKMAAAAGWDPLGLPAFMHTLQREEELSGASGPPSFLRTHPLTEDRVKRGKTYAKKLQQSATDRAAGSHAEFLARLDGLLIGDNPSQGIFRENAFLHPDLGLWLEFPAGWGLMNGRDFVGAQSPDQAARVVLQIAAEGDDPLATAREFAQREGAAFGLLPKQIRLGRSAGARAVGRNGGATVDVSWIAHGGLVYQITGVCRNRDYDAYQTPFIDVALSLRALSVEERGSVTEDRLRIVRAHEGEGLSGLVDRTQARWSAEQTAVANALEGDASLREGQPIKLPIARNYTGPEDPAPSS
jgi:predicted Zn-dependent protease